MPDRLRTALLCALFSGLATAFLVASLESFAPRAPLLGLDRWLGPARPLDAGRIALFAGAAAAFSLASVLFFQWRAARQPPRPPRPFDLAEGERVLRGTIANRITAGVVATPGVLALTTARLIFRPLRGGEDRSLPLDEVRTAEPTRLLGLLPNGVRLELAGDRTERYAMGPFRQSGWLEAIEQARAELTTPSA